MRTVNGRQELEPGDGPLLVSVGVFDGLHLGHVWLLEHLVAEARLRSVRPAVITFDAHPDAILVGAAPPLLMDPAERLHRLAGLGVEVVVIEHFDDALRRTPYDVFVEGIRERTALAELGRSHGFDVVLVPPFTLEGREVRSSDIRSAIAAGNLADAGRLLGRPYALTGECDPDGILSFAMPVALPAAGQYTARIDGHPVRLMVHDGTVRLDGQRAPGRTKVELAT